MGEDKSSWTVPKNSISCFIGRICSLDDNFAKNGIMWVDFYDIDGNKEDIPHDQDGTTQQKVIASWTLRTAYAAWKNPPIIEYRGRMNLTGSIHTSEATIKNGIPGTIRMLGAKLSNVTIAGGTPMAGSVVIPPAIPGVATIPVAIAGATGTANIDCSGTSEINFRNFSIEIEDPNATLFIHTGDSKVSGNDFPGGEDYNIQLKSDKNSQLPWCADVYSAESDEDVYANKREEFIKAGDKALCMAFANSMDNLYCIDIFT